MSRPILEESKSQDATATAAGKKAIGSIIASASTSTEATEELSLSSSSSHHHISSPPVSDSTGTWTGSSHKTNSAMDLQDVNLNTHANAADAMIDIDLLPEDEHEEVELMDEEADLMEEKPDRTGSSLLTMDTTLAGSCHDNEHEETARIITIKEKRISNASLLSDSDDDDDDDQDDDSDSSSQDKEDQSSTDESIRNHSCHGLIQGTDSKDRGLLVRDTSNADMSQTSNSTSATKNYQNGSNHSTATSDQQKTKGPGSAVAAPPRRPQMAKSISNPRLQLQGQLSPNRNRRPTGSSNASLKSFNKNACAPKRPTLRQAPKRAKSESRLKIDFSHSTGTGTADMADASLVSHNSRHTTGPAVATELVKRTTSDRGKLGAMLDSHNHRGGGHDDDQSVSTTSSFQSRHTFKPPESISPESLGNLSNLDISIIDHYSVAGNHDDHTVTTYSSRSTNRSATHQQQRRFPPGFTANHHRVTCPKKDAIPEEPEPEQTSMFRTFSNNLSFLGNFVEQRQKTFATNINVVAELVTNQREVLDIIDEDLNEDSEELRMQERSRRYTQEERSLATYLWGGGGFGRK
ncbi:expressed unknown protein [Seminavis robusta]|uniref:Uncharacterized protein n=1 Tax=Seminavis robusta TaxID=568900 RepID=A0A9N8DAT4_9STRA|nr:expressed unknown protein [Seminavis robusta]|eukprot:Sro38_g023570.1 n/a (578) ;mRNA; r:15267-17000